MENYVWDIVFSSVSYSYSSGLDPDSIKDIISNKPTVKRGAFSVHYTVLNEKASSNFSLVRKDHWLPIKVTGTMDKDRSPAEIQLEFKPLISPLFILGPIMLCLFPMVFSDRFLTNGSPLFSAFCVLFFVAVVILFVHIPIQKEKRTLEQELKLRPL